MDMRDHWDIFWTVFFGAIVVSQALCMVACTSIGIHNRRPMESFLAGALLGPMGILIAIALGPRRHCPTCREPIELEAARCPHCQVVLLPYTEQVKIYEAGKAEQLAAEANARRIEEAQRAAAAATPVPATIARTATVVPTAAPAARRPAPPRRPS